MLGGDFARRLQKLLVGIYNAHIASHGLQNQSRNLVAVFIEIIAQCLCVVVRQNHRMFHKISGNACRRCIADICNARPCRHQKMVGVSVIIALKLHQNIPAGVASRHADCGHCGFRAAIDKPQPFHRRKRAAHYLGEHCLRLGGDAVTTAAHYRIYRCQRHFGISVSEDENAPRHTEVDEPVAVDVGEIRALCVIYKNRCRAYAPERTDGTIDAARNHLAGPVVCRL